MSDIDPDGPDAAFTHFRRPRSADAPSHIRLPGWKIAVR